MSEQPDLFAYAMENLLYEGRSGAVVASDTSRERADRDDADGVTSARALQVLTQLKMRREGMTWFEMAAALNLHHGQASGCLSMLHKAELVFALRTKRGRCHPYVHIDYQSLYSADQRFDGPVKTKASHEKDALNALLIAVDDLLKTQNWNTIRALGTARATYRQKSEHGES